MSSTTPAEAPTIQDRVTDFSSRLSPVLVKELRQGMRTNLFVIAFILLQTFMILCLIAGIADPTSRDTNGFFWFFIIATLLVVQPLRGFSALSSEYQMNTMDLIQLTKLNGWRITLGKWTALNAQGFLFITGVLPYLVIRYYLGNVNFVSDLVALAMIGLGTALATAMTVGCSVFKNIVLRGIMLMGMFFATAMLSSLLSFSALSGRSILNQVEVLILYSLAGVYGILFFLSFGASRISPLSENLATRKRITAIAFVLLAQLFHLSGAHNEVFVVTALILGLALIDAITEPLPVFSKVLVPFRKNALTRIAATFLSPGWISGLGFFLLTIVLFLASLVIAGFQRSTPMNLSDIEGWIVILSIANCVLFPLLIIHLFFPGHSSHHFTFGVYVFIQGALFVFTLMIVAIGNALDSYETLIYLCLPLPSVLFFAASETSDGDSLIHLSIAIATTLICLGFPLLRQRKQVREFFAALKSTPTPDEPAVAGE